MTCDLGTPRTMQSRSMVVQDLKMRVARAEYEVDCRAVAEAFLARHSRCWNPAIRRVPRPSASTRSGVPPVTRPTTDVEAEGSGPHTSSS